MEARDATAGEVPATTDHATDSQRELFVVLFHYNNQLKRHFSTTALLCVNVALNMNQAGCCY